MDTARDSKDIYIPTETIVEEAPRSLPFAYLRTWLAGLLALLLIPLGLGLLVTGMVREERLSGDWVRTQAEIVEVANGRLIYAWEVEGQQQQNFVPLRWGADVQGTLDGATVVTVDLCSIGVRTFLPSETGETFPVWYNPANPKQSDCLPVTVESNSVYTLLGAGALLLAGILLVRLMHGAATQAANRRP